MASNLNQTIKAFKNRGIFVVGLDGDGDSSLPKFALADRPLLVVVGSEGKGLSRLVTENCDAIVSIPIGAATESLNAGIATSISLYEIAMLRGGKRRS
jgi:23S rRNA (guanosine2251-2'-O)-methyltransferase